MSEDSKQLRIEIDRTSFRTPYVVLDERNRWLKVCETLKQAKEFIKEPK